MFSASAAAICKTMPHRVTALDPRVSSHLGHHLALSNPYGPCATQNACVAAGRLQPSRRKHATHRECSKHVILVLVLSMHEAAVDGFRHIARLLRGGLTCPLNFCSLAAQPQLREYPHHMVQPPHVLRFEELCSGTRRQAERGRSLGGGPGRPTSSRGGGLRGQTGIAVHS